MPAEWGWHALILSQMGQGTIDIDYRVPKFAGGTNQNFIQTKIDKKWVDWALKSAKEAEQGN